MIRQTPFGLAWMISFVPSAYQYDVLFFMAVPRYTYTVRTGFWLTGGATVFIYRRFQEVAPTQWAAPYCHVI